MAAVNEPPPETGLPEGYLAIPIEPGEQGAALRVCVLVRRNPEPAVGHFVLLRDQEDARVYLGCVLDAGGRVQEWLEVWVQDVNGLEGSLPAQRESFSNQSLDVRWSRNAEALNHLDPRGALHTGWEEMHPLPCFLDLSRALPVHPAGPDGTGPWELCRDDKLLGSAGLPPFATSLFRYLHPRGAGAEAPFVPVTAGAPSSSATRPLSEAVAESEKHVALNAQGGLLLARRFSPLGFEDYVDLLGGQAWTGIEHGKKRLELDGIYRGLREWEQAQQDNAHLFLGLHGRAGRFLETFHLKLQLLMDAFQQARGWVQEQQLPFLNLSAESFRARLQQIGTSLPLLWTARGLLVQPGAAFALPVETSEFRYFIRGRTGGASVYLPEGLSAPLQGSASVRLRSVLPPDQGRTVLEGTMVLQERLAVSPHDLLWIRLPLPSGRVDLYGHLHAAEALAQGEIRFRTVPQQFPEAVVAALKSAEGVSFARSPFEVVPLLSTPCDLYSMGVLAVRALLVDSRTTLPIAVDEVLSLARQLAAEHNPQVPVGTRVRAILEREPRYAESLGPHRLTREGLAQEAAGRLLPADLWSDTLALVASLFPGFGPDSVCRDFGDVPALALETVFNRPVEALGALLVRSRSLIVIDWKYNQEVQGAISALLGRL
jgi:hypothetical protein